MPGASFARRAIRLAASRSVCVSNPTMRTVRWVLAGIEDPGSRNTAFT